MKKKGDKLIKKIAVKIAVIGANTTCSWFTYQPRVPKAVEKLKKR